MKKFNLEHQYQLYLQRGGVPEERMHPVQRVETKRAFFGACGQILILLRDDVGALEDNEAAKALESLMSQVEKYWAAEVINHQKSN